jgi:hypothetical protein
MRRNNLIVNYLPPSYKDIDLKVRRAADSSLLSCLSSFNSFIQSPYLLSLLWLSLILSLTLSVSLSLSLSLCLSVYLYVCLSRSLEIVPPLWKYSSDKSHLQ